jgi:hypothetical protein
VEEAAEVAGATGEKEFRIAQFRRQRERWRHYRARRAAEEAEAHRTEQIIDRETGEIRDRVVLVLVEHRQDRTRRRPRPARGVAA